MKILKATRAAAYRRGAYLVYLNRFCKLVSPYTRRLSLALNAPENRHLFTDEAAYKAFGVEQDRKPIH